MLHSLHMGSQESCSLLGLRHLDTANHELVRRLSFFNGSESFIKVCLHALMHMASPASCVR